MDGLWIELITNSETPICEFVLTGYSENPQMGDDFQMPGCSVS
jgi:hypothetical protein